MKKVLNVLRIAYYIMGIIGMLVCMPFYLGLYFSNKKGS